MYEMYFAENFIRSLHEKKTLLGLAVCKQFGALLTTATFNLANISWKDLSLGLNFWNAGSGSIALTKAAFVCC